MVIGINIFTCISLAILLLIVRIMSEEKIRISNKFIAVVALTLITAACSRLSINENTDMYNIYYFNQTDNSMTVESIALGFAEDAIGEVILYSIVEQLYNRIISNISVVPINLHLRNNVASVAFGDNYLELTATEQILLRASLIYTLTDLDFIEGVEFFIDAQPLTNNYGVTVGVMDKEDIIFAGINPNPTTNYQNITLYFRKEGTNALVAENREIQVNKDVPLEQYILEELVRGPMQSGLEATLPQTTTINYIETKENVCQVDLSYNRQAKEILAEYGEELFVYSIVNSLTEIWTIQKVGFLINGEKQDYVAGSMDLNVLFERNENVITSK